ncbi:putative RNA helicase [Medicago truncatula]|uniref:Putative RNA helicase n=1 Tax=Medicago truncatula TaxID=3880 RepID=A0A396GH21_MEDTR|nr:putative RNA helicase [Medicago truncatula]
MIEGVDIISVNSKQTIPYPWLVFNEKVKIKQVLIRDSTGVSDLMLILFGGALSNGKQPGHLKMLDGYVDFFMDPNLADCCLKLKGELDRLIQKKVSRFFSFAMIFLVYLLIQDRVFLIAP